MNHVENFRHLDACHTPLLHLCPSVKVSKCHSALLFLPSLKFLPSSLRSLSLQLASSFCFLSPLFLGTLTCQPLLCLLSESQIVTQHCSYVHLQHLQYCLLWHQKKYIDCWTPRVYNPPLCFDNPLFWLQYISLHRQWADFSLISNDVRPASCWIIHSVQSPFSPPGGEILSCETMSWSQIHITSHPVSCYPVRWTLFYMGQFLSCDVRSYALTIWGLMIFCSLEDAMQQTRKTHDRWWWM